MCDFTFWRFQQKQHRGTMCSSVLGHALSLCARGSNAVLNSLGSSLFTPAFMSLSFLGNATLCMKCDFFVKNVCYEGPGNCTVEQGQGCRTRDIYVFNVRGNTINKKFKGDCVRRVFLFWGPGLGWMGKNLSCWNCWAPGIILWHWVSMLFFFRWV